MRYTGKTPRSESEVESQSSEWALRVGVPSTKMGQQGWPDRIFWIPGGSPLLVEFKFRNKQPVPLQAHRINQLRELGYKVEVHNDPQKFAASILSHLEAARLPAQSHEVPAGARSGGPIPEAWAGED